MAVSDCSCEGMLDLGWREEGARQLPKGSEDVLEGREARYCSPTPQPTQYAQNSSGSAVILHGSLHWHELSLDMMCVHMTEATAHYASRHFESNITSCDAVLRCMTQL